MGDDNALTLEVSAENQGEGAYEAELHVYPPQQADFTGVVRSQVRPLASPVRSQSELRLKPSTSCLQTLSRLSCAYKKENQTKMVVCDLGNPMKGGTKVSDHMTPLDRPLQRMFQIMVGGFLTPPTL